MLGCQKAQSPPPWKEEVASSFHGDEIRHPRKAERPPCRGNRKPVRAACRRETIDLILQAMEACRLRPSLLHKLELPLDIGVQAHEEQALFLELSLRAITPANPQDPVTVADGELFGRIARSERVSRIGSADMRSKRAAQSVGIVIREQEIVVGAS